MTVTVRAVEIGVRAVCMGGRDTVTLLRGGAGMACCLRLRRFR